MVLAGVAGLVLTQVFVPPAKAADSVQAWEASANSAVVGASPSASGVFLTSTIGQAYAAYDQTETQATSALVNLGGLGYAVASSPVCGLALSLSQQPQTLTADSTDGSSSKTAQAQLAPGVVTPAGTGTEHVSVSAHPESAEARTYPVTQTVPGLLEVEGVAQSDVRYVDGQAQEASSSVTENLTLLGGIVKLTGLTWSASQQRKTGDPSNATGFGFSSVTISGAGLPIDIPGTVPLSTAVSQLNAVLGVLGVTISPPTQTVDPGTGAVSMSPLQVHFSGSAIDNALASPAIAPLTQLINLLNGQVTHGADCSNIKNLLGDLSTIPETGLNLLLSGLSGSGAVDLYFGGASADTLAAPSFSNPFDFAGGLATTALPPSGVAGVTVPGGESALPLSDTSPASAVAAVTAAPTPTISGGPSGPGGNPRTVAAVKCATTSPSGGTGCWRGVATWAAAAVVVLGGGLLAADVVYSRRGPRSIRRRRRVLP